MTLSIEFVLWLCVAFAASFIAAFVVLLFREIGRMVRWVKVMRARRAIQAIAREQFSQLR